MIVYNWKFERTQVLEYEKYEEDMNITSLREDIWYDVQDGASVGAQLAVGGLYKIASNLFLDFSAAYHFVNISNKYGALAYYGYPARQIPGEPTNELIPDSKGQADFIQVRFGVRFGS